jgi:hypothetical protein
MGPEKIKVKSKKKTGEDFHPENINEEERMSGPNQKITSDARDY